MQLLESISTPPASQSTEAQIVRKSVDRFVAWLEQTRYASYDPYDVWGTRYGLLARRLYYARNPLGFVLTAPVLVMEMLCPGLRAVFVRKQRSATADAQVLLAFLNLYQLDANSLWINKARSLADELLNYAVRGFSGYCWGYPFDWQNLNGLMPKGTPVITATPYCFEAFLRLFELAGDERYLGVAGSIAEFVHNDLNDSPNGEHAAAASYTPHDHGMVVNASAYRALVLFEAAHRFNKPNFTEKAWKNLNFILQAQRPDGSWLYAMDNPREHFIDHFHTCFVLKNLYKLNRRVQSSAVTEAIQAGYAYYRKNLFDAADNPKSFAISPRTQIAKIEMYNIAEAITLGTLLREMIPDAFALARRLGARLATNYQVDRGHFLTRLYVGGLRHKTPFLRWPQAQLFYAQTNLLLALLP